MVRLRAIELLAVAVDTQLAIGGSSERGHRVAAHEPFAADGRTGEVRAGRRRQGECDGRPRTGALLPRARAHAIPPVGQHLDAITAE